MKTEATNKELVAAGHQLAKALGSASPLLDMAKLVSDLATRLDVALVRGDELQQKLDALAAESASLKEFGDKLNDMHNNLNGEGTRIQGRAEVACQQVVLEAALEEFDAIETPATDAYLNSVRAEGTIMFASKQLAAAGDLESTITLERLVLNAEEFYEQLRGSKDGE